MYTLPLSERRRRCGTRSHDALFGAGFVSITDTAHAALAKAGTTSDMLLRRHCAGDWYEMTETHRQRNYDALGSGGRILSSFVLSTGCRVWVVTEGDRSSTSLLLPGEL